MLFNVIVCENNVWPEYNKWKIVLTFTTIADKILMYKIFSFEEHFVANTVNTVSENFPSY